MPAQQIKVVPPALLNAAAGVAAAAQEAAAPQPGAVPVAAPASPADGALAAIATEIATQTAQMSAEVAGKGPAVTAKTSAGVARLESQDVQNADDIEAVGMQAEQHRTI